MHKSNFCNNGFIVPGSFDISRWFRPVNPALQIYDNNTVINSLKDDPIMYINFKTKQNVKLYRFMLINDLKSSLYSSSKYKQYSPNKPLEHLYNTFFQNNLNKKTLRLIKDNLI